MPDTRRWEGRRDGFGACRQEKVGLKKTEAKTSHRFSINPPGSRVRFIRGFSEVSGGEGRRKEEGDKYFREQERIEV